MFGGWLWLIAPFPSAAGGFLYRVLIARGGPQLGPVVAGSANNPEKKATATGGLLPISRKPTFGFPSFRQRCQMAHDVNHDLSV